MSAVITLWQREAAHVLVDGLSYDAEGVVGAISQKCVARPVAGYAVASLGPVGPNRALEEALTALFPSFDALVDGIEEVAAPLFHRFASDTSYPSSAGQFIFAGWSARHDAPGIYSMTVHEPGETDFWLSHGEEAFKLRQVDMLGVNPPFDPAVLRSVGFTSENMDPSKPDWLERINPRVDLLLMMEAQRRKPAGRWGPPRHLVGGVALLTTIDRAGIRQEVIHRWPEDRIGEVVTPEPFDVRRWREEHPRVVSLETESRLRREMRERRDRKAGRR